MELGGRLRFVRGRRQGANDPQWKLREVVAGRRRGQKKEIEQKYREKDE
jgi:hypothetical protein